MAPPGDTLGMPVSWLPVVAARFPRARAIEFVCRRFNRDAPLLTAFLASMPDGVCPGVEYLKFDCDTPLTPSHVMNLLRVFPALDCLVMYLAVEPAPCTGAPENEGRDHAPQPRPWRHHHHQQQQQQQQQQNHHVLVVHHQQLQRPAMPSAAGSLRELSFLPQGNTGWAPGSAGPAVQQQQHHQHQQRPAVPLTAGSLRELSFLPQGNTGWAPGSAGPAVAALLQPLTGLHFLEANGICSDGWEALREALPPMTALAGLTVSCHADDALPLLPLAGLPQLRELDIEVHPDVFKRQMWEGGPLAQVTKFGVGLPCPHMFEEAVSTADIAAGLPALKALIAGDVNLFVDKNSMLPHLTSLETRSYPELKEALRKVAPALQYVHYGDRPSALQPDAAVRPQGSQA